MYSFYNGRQGKLQYYCSRKCYAQTRVTRLDLVACPVSGCKKRCLSNRGLRDHWEHAHRRITKESFVDALLAAQGKKPQKYCPVCGVRLKPSIIYGDYTTCRCVNAERKIEDTRKLIETCSDPEETMHLKRRLAGLHSVMTKMRRERRPRRKRKLRKVVSPAIPADHALKEDARFFREVQARMEPVYGAYDDMLRALVSPTRRLLREKNSKLIGLLKQYEWDRLVGAGNGCYLYVAACDPESLEGASQKPIFFASPIRYSRHRYDKALKETGLSANEIDSHIGDVVGTVTFRLERPKYQCWHRFCIVEPGKQQFAPTPVVLLTIKKSLNK